MNQFAETLGSRMWVLILVTVIFAAAVGRALAIRRRMKTLEPVQEKSETPPRKTTLAEPPSE